MIHLWCTCIVCIRYAYYMHMIHVSYTYISIWHIIHENLLRYVLVVLYCVKMWMQHVFPLTQIIKCARPDEKFHSERVIILTMYCNVRRLLFYVCSVTVCSELTLVTKYNLYYTDSFVNVNLFCKRIQRILKTRKHKETQKKPKPAENRSHLASVRYGWMICGLFYFYT